jgi:hypothetical protein
VFFCFVQVRFADENFFIACVISFNNSLELSVSEVSYKPSHLTYNFFFLSSLTSSLTSFVCETFLDWICQHWLSYNKLSSNNNNNNNHHVSVIQVCVSELTTCRPSFVQHLCCHSHSYRHWCQFAFFVDQQQLAWYAHFSKTMIILLCSVTMFCLYRTVSHWLRWELISHCTSMWFWFRVKCVDFCQLCWLSETQYDTFKMSCMSEHFNECCNNCKWHDHTAHYSVHNNDVLIIISDDENNNSTDENECVAKLTNCTDLTVTRAVVIDLNLRYIWLFFSCVASSIGLVVWAVYNICAVCLISVWCLTSSFDKIKKASLVISIEINQINLTLNFELCTIPQTHEAFSLLVYD